MDWWWGNQNNFGTFVNGDGDNCRQNKDSLGEWNCDSENINTRCHFDEGGCCDELLIGNSECDTGNNFTQCQFDGSDYWPPNITDWTEYHHNPTLIDDWTCDNHLKSKLECNYDTTDCCSNLVHLVPGKWQHMKKRLNSLFKKSNLQKNINTSKEFYLNPYTALTPA